MIARKKTWSSSRVGCSGTAEEEMNEEYDAEDCRATAEGDEEEENTTSAAPVEVDSTGFCDIPHPVRSVVLSKKGMAMRMVGKYTDTCRTRNMTNALWGQAFFRQGFVPYFGDEIRFFYQLFSFPVTAQEPTDRDDGRNDIGEDKRPPNAFVSQICVL